MPVIIFHSGVSVSFTINLPKCKNVNLTFSSAFASKHNNVKVQQYTCTKCIYKCILSKYNSHEQTLFQHVVSLQQVSFDLFFRNVSFGVMPATVEQFYMILGVFLPRYVVYSGIFGYIDKWLGNQRLNRYMERKLHNRKQRLYRHMGRKLHNRCQRLYIHTFKKMHNWSQRLYKYACRKLHNRKQGLYRHTGRNRNRKAMNRRLHNRNQLL